MEKFTFKEIKEICKKAANGDEIAQKFLNYIDEEISRRAMNEYVEEETGKEYGEADSTRKYTDEALELIYKESTKDDPAACDKIEDFGIDDRKRFCILKSIREGHEAGGKIREIPDDELLWIHCGMLKDYNSAINLWHGLSGDDLERYNEIDTPEWDRSSKYRDYPEFILQSAKSDIQDGLTWMDAQGFTEKLTGGDLHRFNRIMSGSDIGGEKV